MNPPNQAVSTHNIGAFQVFLVLWVAFIVGAPLPLSWFYGDFAQASATAPGAFAALILSVGICAAGLRLCEADRRRSATLAAICIAFNLNECVAALRGGDGAFGWAATVCVACAFLEQAYATIVFRAIAWLVAANALSACALYAIGFQTFHTPGFGARLSGYWQTPNAVYPLYLVGLSLFLGPISGKSRYIVWGAVAVLLAAEFLTFTRGAGLACGLLLVMYGIRELGGRRYALFAVGACLLLAPFIARKGAGASVLSLDAGSAGRLDIWKHLLAAVPHAGLWGGGSTYFGQHPLVIAGKVYVLNDGKNLFLDVWVRHGLFGLALWGVVLVGLSRREGEARVSDRKFAAQTLTYALIVAGLVDVPVWSDFTRVPATVLYAAVLGLGLSPMRSANSVSPCRFASDTEFGNF